MCGIYAIASVRGGRPSLSGDQVASLRDRLAHRGPDGAGLADLGHVILGHRRLAVVDPGPEGDQPFRDEAGGAYLVYNGELYNDDELREWLSREGVVFRTRSDTETLLHALVRWGEEALPRLRGMFAFVFVDVRAQRVLAARDPLGIKPLYAWVRSRRAGDEVVFASELGALASHPEYQPRAGMPVVSAYLSTIRTTLGARTLMADLVTLRAGEVWSIDLSGERLRIERRRFWNGRAPGGAKAAASDVREAIETSVRAHLRSDVPLCSLLSGGLDSSIVAKVAHGAVHGLRTYCAGAAGETPGDLEAAATMAGVLGTAHTRATITRALFEERWAWIVERSGLPLSTPNEVAINEVARCLRRDGMVVALSGEGADEFFGGYDGPLAAAAAWHAGAGGLTPGELRSRCAALELDLCAWIPPKHKGQILRSEVWRGLEQDGALRAHHEEEFGEAMEESLGDSPLQAHLAYQRRVNLGGLLARLDSSMMLEGVEGRTPLADVRLAELASSLPMREKYVPGQGVTGTKIALRRAFAGDLPAWVVERPKASFPLPFQGWMDTMVGALKASESVRDFIRPEIVAQVCERPGEHWRFAWPLINLALWTKRWWGR